MLGSSHIMGVSITTEVDRIYYSIHISIFYFYWLCYRIDLEQADLHMAMGGVVKKLNEKVTGLGVPSMYAPERNLLMPSPEHPKRKVTETEIFNISKEYFLSETPSVAATLGRTKRSLTHLQRTSCCNN